MKVAVLIASYNRAAFIGAALRSVLAQEGPFTLDVLVVDDGSTDDTAERVAAIATGDPRLRYVRRENGGIAAARNTSLDHVTDDTDFITFLDSDDTMPPGRIAADLKLLAADPTLDMTYGRMTFVDRIDPRTLLPAKGAAEARARAIHMSCALMRRSLVDRIGRFDETLKQAEDTDYLLRIFEIGTRCRETETDCLYYLRHEGGISRNVAEARQSFLKAIIRSMARRKKDPSRVLRLPEFEFEDPERGRVFNAGFRRSHTGVQR